MSPWEESVGEKSDTRSTCRLWVITIFIQCFDFYIYAMNEAIFSIKYLV